MLHNPSAIEEDGAADPLFELWPTPKNKHLALLYYFVKLAEVNLSYDLLESPKGQNLNELFNLIFDSIFRRLDTTL